MLVGPYSSQMMILHLVSLLPFGVCHLYHDYSGGDVASIVHVVYEVLL